MDRRGSGPINNLEDYDTFEMVEDVGQETIGSNWVILKKEKHDDKAHLVERGFQEADKPQSESPMLAKESLKSLIALTANEDFDLPSMNIRQHSKYHQKV